jgi:hypothetical protein
VLLSADQPLILAFRLAVTAIGILGQPVTVDDLYVSAHRLDEPTPGERVDSIGHTGPPDAQHHRDELMSERQVGSVHPIIRHQQPTRQPLLNFGPAIGDGCLGELDVVFTDIRLGNGPDGWDVAEEARKARPGIRVVYTSANVAVPGRDVAGSIFIAKPYDPSAVLKACRKDSR